MLDEVGFIEITNLRLRLKHVPPLRRFVVHANTLPLSRDLLRCFVPRGLPSGWMFLFPHFSVPVFFPTFFRSL